MWTVAEPSQAMRTQVSRSGFRESQYRCLNAVHKWKPPTPVYVIGLERHAFVVQRPGQHQARPAHRLRVLFCRGPNREFRELVVPGGESPRRVSVGQLLDPLPLSHDHVPVEVDVPSPVAAVIVSIEAEPKPRNP